MGTKQNSGAIFKNNKKEKETQPDYNGTINWKGEDISVAMWIKKSKLGTSYFSVALKEPYKKETAIKPNNSFNNDMPF